MQAAIAAFASTLAMTAGATNITEFPDNGVEQSGRGGAWIARASDPLATFYNPAALAGMGRAATLQVTFSNQHTCFSRQRAANDTSVDPYANADGSFPRVCNDFELGVLPQLGLSWPITDRVGLGFAFITPSSTPNVTWPEFVNGPSGPTAPPNRYLLVRQRAVIVFPTVGIGALVAKDFRVGASFSWGMAHLRLASAISAINQDGLEPKGDVRANLQVKDLFVPGVTFGALYSPRSWLDLAAWFRVSDSVRARGDVGTAANYYNPNNAAGNDRDVKYGDTIFSDCGTGRDTDVCRQGGNATFRLPIPMEAKLGFRFHEPRVTAIPDEPVDLHSTKRDPIHDDVFDVELDLTYAHNRAFDSIGIRFPDDGHGQGVLPVAGVPTGAIPPNADVPKGFRDVLGVRMGGDYNVLPDRLAVRAGAFFESRGQDPRYQNLDIAGAERFGLSMGGTYRLALGDTSSIDFLASVGHVFVATLRNNGPQGVRALAGTACNPPSSGAECAGGNPSYRTNWPTNLGTISNSLNSFQLGATMRW